MSILSKRDVFTELWMWCCKNPDGGIVRVVLNPHRTGVMVPGHLNVDPAPHRGPDGQVPSQLVLDFDSVADMPPVLNVDPGENTLKATLSFNGSPFNVVIPWAAIYLISCIEAGVIVQWEPTQGVPSATSEEITAVDRPKLKLV